MVSEAFRNPFAEFGDLLRQPDFLRLANSSPHSPPSHPSPADTPTEAELPFESAGLRKELQYWGSVESVYWMYKFLRREWYRSAPSGTPLTDAAYRQAMDLPPIDFEARLDDPSRRYSIFACTSRDALWLTKPKELPQQIKSPWTVSELTAYQDRERLDESAGDRNLEELAMKYGGYIPFGVGDFNRAKKKKEQGLALSSCDLDCIKSFDPVLEMDFREEDQYRDARKRFKELCKDPEYIEQLKAEQEDDTQHLMKAIQHLEEDQGGLVTAYQPQDLRHRPASQLLVSSEATPLSQRRVLGHSHRRIPKDRKNRSGWTHDELEILNTWSILLSEPASMESADWQNLRGQLPKRTKGEVMRKSLNLWKRSH